MSSIEQLKEIAEKCVRCGICQSVCPVFTEVNREAAVARGKVSLIRKVLSEETGYTPRMSTYLLQCLGCGACTENCPNGVKVDDLVLAMRALMVEEKGLSLSKQLILRGFLNSVHVLPMFLKTGSLLQGLLLKKVPKESGLHLRFSLPYLGKERLIPSLETPFFLDRYPEQIEAAGENPRNTKDGQSLNQDVAPHGSLDGITALRREKKIGLFAGCSINYLFPSIGESTLRLLRKGGFSVILPKEQACCGLPAYGSGDLETAKSLALRTIKAFAHSGSIQILVPCASCFYFLKEGYQKLFPDDEEVASFTRRIVEPTSFFVEQIVTSQRPEGSPGNRKVRVTYHDPCHLRRGMKIHQEPRRLLKSLPGVELVEMKQPSRCCGMAGSFNLIYYDLSKKILKRKVEDIAGTGAEHVVTSCMGCMIQLKDGLHQQGLETGVMHPVEVLEKSLVEESIK